MRPLASRMVRAAAVASFVVAATAGAVPAAQATPIPPCSGAGCNGLDPQTTGCGGSAYTVASFNFDNGAVTALLRYSTWCHANWTTLSIHNYLPADSGEFWVQNQNNNAQYYSFDTLSGATSTWTNMVNGIPLARSCVQDNVSYPNGHCTLWH